MNEQSITKQSINKQLSSKDVYDIIIVGGGMVGASLAVALLPLKLKVALVDEFEFGAPSQPSYDDRAIALSYGSSLIFKGMGLWDELKAKTTGIKSIHVSDRGHFGAARLSAEKEKVPSLGYLVESKVLGQQLYEVLKNTDVDLIQPASVKNLSESDNAVTLELDNNNELSQISARLLVAADGTTSKIRELSGINITRSDYKQSAIVSNVSTEKPHNGEAFERFTDNGPIALLPMSDNRCSLVWTHNTEGGIKGGTESLDAVMAMSDEDFLNELGKEFGYRLGRFTRVGKRSTFPLSLVTADKNTANRTVIIGNASHTLHPVAGQGLNLALRDVAVLTDLVADLMGSNQTESTITNIASLLSAYEEARKGDLKGTIQYTDSLVRLFSNDQALLGHARAGGLLAFDRLPPLRNWLTRKSMGINYRQSRLARGLALRVAS
ncbi:2-octaprenyl-6-methoxyphenyl hydroxylase [Cocleimonas sp. KMM 6892]|uniref:2-octaprenyl-6-methoxyphenyl hydroxylase n=1 Tax=unclassified Cocleimonas TaxID=2639732 RepID=UPI002DB938AC|nr:MULTISPECIES: 2-octaprenyl-6-methoxyphenyl hydroxylase [unclassified Cocleimonas]MEB8430917.1 2-octaprenyl-6-methoxyphenyl hydroxylase [Cocleimonas sp. KMM 6892]MEC4714311.1 2-octaprenyl-6-methoxyphenyl hydroxylase [Cocleimonas sp. KMM 6895]MEC4743642.1 2-octaprenyl-6-methoxyphenyl hydroxylase [Cocleimonas sp. KMM 6896]